MSLEDYTIYTEVDPGSNYSVSENKIEVIQLPRQQTAYLTFDYGVDHFGEVFSHDFQVKITADDGFGSRICVHAVSDVIDDVADWSANTNDALYTWFRGDSGRDINLTNAKSGEIDTYAGYVVGTTYYMTAERTSDTTYVLRIYSDSIRSTLLDTLAIGITSGTKYQYVFGVNSWHEAFSQKVSADIENLNLNLSASSIVPILLSQRRRRV